MAKFCKSEAKTLVNDVLTKCGKKEDDLEKAIGNNGYRLGQEFHLGDFGIGSFTIDGKEHKYPAIQTEEGYDLSLEKLMNISALGSYITEGSAESQCYAVNEKGEQIIITKEVEAHVVDGFDFETMVFQPKSRNYRDFLEWVADGHLKGKVARYLGKVVLPIVAKKSSPAAFSETWGPGMKRTITKGLWQIEDAKPTVPTVDATPAVATV